MVEPHEALQLPDMPTDTDTIDALKDICTAVNGFPYPGHRSEAIVLAVTWLREHPEHCKTLGLGARNGD